VLGLKTNLNFIETKNKFNQKKELEETMFSCDLIFCVLKQFFLGCKYLTCTQKVFVPTLSKTTWLTYDFV